VILTWILSAAASGLILGVLKVTLGLRVSRSDEYDGLDLTQHGEAGYNFDESIAEFADSLTTH
jgi:Amt family ammonium transporter